MGKKNSAGMELTDGQLAKIAETASRVAIEEYHREAEKTRQENKDKRLYNTRLLMEKYRGLVEYAEDAIYDAIQLDEDVTLQSLMELMGCKKQNDDGLLTVESIQVRAARTRIILSHVNKMLEFYHHRCSLSGKTEIERKWLVIYHLYVSNDEKTIAELASEFCVDERTVYRYNRMALEELSALFFGSIE